MLMSLLVGLLSAREREIDTTQLVFYGIVVVASILSGILQKRKSDSKKSETGKPPTGSKSPKIASRRPVQPPVLKQEFPPHTVTRPTRPIASTRVARPARIPGATSLPPTPSSAARAVTVHEVVRAALPAVEPTQPRRLTIDRGQPRPVSVPELAGGAEAALRARVRAALRDRSQLQAAFVLSEILAPPLALREPRRLGGD